MLCVSVVRNVQEILKDWIHDTDENFVQNVTFSLYSEIFSG